MLFTKYNLRSKNVHLLCLSQFLMGLLFFLPILALYFEKNLFSITNVALIYSLQAFSSVIFEVPTGAIADLFGRKRTLLLAYLTLIIALLFLYFGKNMLMFSIYAILIALAGALVSGTDSALIYDTLKEEKKEQYFRKIIGIYSALWPAGATFGSIIGGHLAKISFSLPILLTFFPIILAFLTILFLKEPSYEKANHHNIFKQMLHSSQAVVENKQALLLMLGSLILFAFGESTHLLNALYFEFKSVPLVYFGYIFAFIFGCSSLGQYFSHELAEKLGTKKVLIGAVICSPLMMIFSTFTLGLSSIIFFMVQSLFYGIRVPIIDSLLHQEISSSQRATTISLAKFMGHLGVAVFAPILGYLAELYTINTAFRISAFCMFSVAVLFLWLKKS